MSIDEYFAERPAVQRRIYDAVVRHLAKLGPLTIDAVDVGILIKKTRTFAELRPKRDRVALAVLVSRVIDDPRIAKVLRTSAHRAACFVDLRGPRDVDRHVRAWLTEAYLASPE
jgi:hypothetical protein